MFTFQQLVAYLEGQGGGPEGEPRQKLPNLQGKVLVIVVEDNEMVRSPFINLLDNLRPRIEILGPDFKTSIQDVELILFPPNLNKLIEILNPVGVVCFFDNNLNGLIGSGDKSNMGFELAKKIWIERRRNELPNLRRVRLIGASSNQFGNTADPDDPTRSVQIVDSDPTKENLDRFILDGEFEKIISEINQLPE